ncbi:FAD-dependent oxidoreductase [Candidatus Uhrbacteria bacterium]|nr:FAD-dependent oxidoreductase [Candidatus Uhrbacteria bacterium]
MYDLLVVGSGAAGLSAGIYAGRYLLNTVIVQGKDFGGETAVAALIENYPGYIEIDGYDLMVKMKEQAEHVGAKIMAGWVTAITKKAEGHFVATLGSGETLEAKSVILATGSRRRRLNLPNEEALTGKGVSYCTTCDAPLYKGKTIAIIGGGDSSVKGANLAALYAEKVYLIARGKAVNAEPVNYARLTQKKNVEMVYETEVKEIIGADRLEKIILSKPLNGSVELALGGLFVEVGALPNNDLAKSLGVELDARGFVEVDPFMQANIPGVMVAGDLCNETGGFKQDIVAAAQGSMAATSAYQYVGGLMSTNRSE